MPLWRSTRCVAVVSTRSADGGVIIPFAARDSTVLSLRMEYRSASPVALQVWKVDAQLEKLENITLYNDAAPESPDAWRVFETTVFVPFSQAHSHALFPFRRSIGTGAECGVAPGGTAKIEVRGLQLRPITTRSAPYHRLEMDRPAEKTIFAFADETVPDTLRGYRLASQLHLADGLDFKGGDTEKVLYADLMMLTWIAGPETFRPILAPSIWYSAAGEMYLRDSFFALNGIHNRGLNESGIWPLGAKIRDRTARSTPSSNPILRMWSVNRTIRRRSG